MTAELEKSRTNEADNEASRDKAFRRAVAHSRRVRFLKFALPAGAVLLVGGFVGYSYLSVPGSISFDVSESAFANGKLVMASPKIDGFTKENRPYSMMATRALQHTDDSGIVELEGIDAKLPVSEKVFAVIGAERGVYDRNNNTLDVPSPITVQTTDGMTAKLKSAFLEITAGNLKTNDPVDIRLEGAKIVADAMTVLENGKVLIFEKRVKLELAPDRLKERPAPTAEGSENVQN